MLFLNKKINMYFKKGVPRKKLIFWGIHMTMFENFENLCSMTYCERNFSLN